MQTTEQQIPEKISIRKHSIGTTANTIQREIFKREPHKRKRFKRLSPFLLLAYFFPMLFTYSLIKGKINGEDFWFQSFLFFFLEINVLFIDFAIWNYYKYKKTMGIWLVESFLALAILYLVI
jgi:hypothetical protein